MTTYSNLVSMNRATCAEAGPRTAIRFRRFGRYTDLTWNEVRSQADQAASGLIQLGIQPGDRVAIFSENRQEWILTDLAILSTGAADVAMHAPLAPEQAAYQLEHSGSRGVFVSNQQQADKIFDVIDQLPDLEFLISYESVSSSVDESRLKVLSWDGLKHRGWSQLKELRIEIDFREQSITGETLATVIYTSGTTGPPKGVMLSHGNLITNANAVLSISEIHPQYVILSWLPYSHIYARTVDLYISQLVQGVIALAESVETLVDNLREIQPHWMTSVPRFYEKLWSSIERLPEEKRAPALKGIFGRRLHHLASGGAPLPKQICETFNNLGVPLLEGYGLTETSPVIAFNRFGQVRPGTVGQAVPRVEIRIAEDGEILSRGPHIMQGYWQNHEATSKVIVDDWFHTGDIGELDDEGFLKITDRKKDIIVTSSGKNIAPTEIERLLKMAPLIDQAVVYGDNRNFITAILVPAFDLLESTLRDQGVRLQSKAEFIDQKEILELYTKVVEQQMIQVSNPERVRRFLVLSRPFSLSEDELTATQKVRRRHVIDKYQEELNALYTNVAHLEDSD
ncbi:Long-chain-fatty-acid--CoA ligase FadD15 [Polystyrenella longa]|uniref:Long-chain-fatty-acid--CoA ligase FadD15 n=1 Tax=Polystyrenella longa TaxID=2528007 RepID=A0A518CLK5_9PLAN|nr:AMP-dependent synthetase/ligase [Polystyrenella longa]QDU80093.1 Long-chain-fatty-acid--CoA ligase FadD15 [Polystyrenella longa]